MDQERGFCYSVFDYFLLQWNQVVLHLIMYMNAVLQGHVDSVLHIERQDCLANR